MEKDPNRQNCCARRILSCQPDFLKQKSALEEVTIASNHMCEKYPKFHCEYNFIERYWGYAKREIRRRCSYKYDDLVRVIPLQQSENLQESHGGIWMHVIKA